MTKVLILDGHPDAKAEHLCHALAEAYAEGAEAGGHEVRRMRIADLEFSLLRSGADFEGATPPPADIAEAQRAIREAEHIVLVFPIWLGGMPALLKGFLEQTLRPDFAFERADSGFPKRLLKGRSARLVVTMGMPTLLYRFYYGAPSIKSLEMHILKFCGISPVRRSLFGMVEAVTDQQREAWLEKLRDLGRKAR
ncbi:MAG: NAD(P)H-dependent oxidoreductase [Limibacillus sp.]|jgi:putative NADPH-quinone reductase